MEASLFTHILGAGMGRTILVVGVMAAGTVLAALVVSAVVVGELAEWVMPVAALHGALAGYFLAGKVTPGKVAAAVTLVFVGLTQATHRPTPPPETPAGAVPQFDALLAEADSKWTFLFGDRKRLLLADVSGAEVEELFAPRRFPALPASAHGAGGRLSPDRRRLLVVDDRNPKPRLYVLDLATGHVDEARVPPIPAAGDGQPGERADSLESEYLLWLSPSSFLVPLTRYRPNSWMHPNRFVRFDLADLEHPSEVSFRDELVKPEQGPVVFRTRLATRLVFCDGETMRGGLPESRAWRVRALDVNGFRDATAAESEEFLLRDFHRPTGPCEATVEQVPLPITYVCNDRGWHPMMFRRDLYLDGRWVRRTEPGVGAPEWDPNLKLYVWDEHRSEDDQCPVTYLMDAQGHYRKWRDGWYFGPLRKDGDVIEPQG
jgi:hypothetical protein